MTDNHRDVELAADLLPSMTPGHRRVRPDMAASPSTTGEEPGYGLGATAPGETDGEGGVETPPPTGRGRVILFRGRLGKRPEESEISFEPDANWASEMGEEFEWQGLNDIPPLPAHYGQDVTMVLVRNPRSLYVYWERAGYGDENLRSLLGEEEYTRATPCLRVFDVTSGAFPGQQGGHVWTIDVGESDDHWFLSDGIEPGREYAVSYERRTSDGRYYQLSHSWPVRTPHDSPAPAAEWDVTTGMLYQLYVRQPGEQGRSHPGSQWR